MTLTAIVNITMKVVICLYAKKMVLSATMAEYKLEVAHSVPYIIMAARTIGLIVKCSYI